MNRKHILLWILACCILFASFTTTYNHPVTLVYPPSWPKPIYNFTNNPLTQEGIQLGRKLFYDPSLSRNNTVSCSSCHLSYTAFTHVDHKLSHGINDRIGIRNSPALMNLAWNKSFMWDGSANHLDMQALAPISDPNEMDSSIKEVVEKLETKSEYSALFLAAYGDDQITGARVLKALSQFQLTLISANSKYDHIVAGKDTFTQQEQSGYLLFKKHCSTCHKEPLFTTGDFANNGLPIDSKLHDVGRMKITKNPQDSMSFKIPSLRNLKYSFPYMHDGRFKTLGEVIEHYTEHINNKNFIDSRLKKVIYLSDNQKIDLIAFLQTLNDKKFVFNKDFAFPR